MTTTAQMEQWTRGLNAANKIRTKRAAERKRIYAMPFNEGRQEVAKLLLKPPAWLVSAKIGDVLTWPRRSGRSYAHRLLLRLSYHSFPVAEARRVGSLSDMQRARLAGMLRGDSGDEA